MASTIPVYDANAAHDHEKVLEHAVEDNHRSEGIDDIEHPDHGLSHEERMAIVS